MSSNYHYKPKIRSTATSIFTHLQFSKIYRTTEVCFHVTILIKFQGKHVFNTPSSCFSPWISAVYTAIRLWGNGNSMYCNVAYASDRKANIAATVKAEMLMNDMDFVSTTILSERWTSLGNINMCL